MASSLIERRGFAHQQDALLPITSVQSHKPPQKRPITTPAPKGLLTWRFAILCILAVCGFFLGHVTLSNYLGINLKRQQQAHAAAASRAPLTIHHNQQAQRATDIKRILVLGSHHTGTSIVTRLIMEMGANAGENLLMLPGNDLKYNEHRIAVEANKRVLSKGHDPTKKRHGPLWVDYGFDFKYVRAEERELFFRAINRVFNELDESTRSKQQTAWVLKDPRLSILAKHWLERLPSSNTVCVLVVRDAMETSVRLAKNYNRPTSGSLHVWEWMEVWEESMLNAAHYCKELGMRIVFAHHAELTKSAFVFAQKLEMDLFQATNRFHSKEEVDKILGANFVATGGYKQSEPTVWLPTTRQLFNALQTENLANLPPLASAWSMHSHQQQQQQRRSHRREAYATIITGDNKGFVAGAIALAASIRRFDSNRALVAMLSPEVENDTPNLQALKLAGWELLRVDKLEEPWYQTHAQCREFTDSQQVRWGRMFTKLRVYSLVQFSRILYLDTDVIALRELDYYFELQGGDFFAERSPSHRGINAGIMVIKPSLRVLRRLINFARENEPRVFWPHHQVGCTEQELLNRFWNAQEAPRKLNNTRHFDFLGERFLNVEEGRGEIAQHGARLAHCLTTKCFKPWEVAVELLLFDSPSYDAHAVQANCDPLMYLIWYSYYMSDGMAEARRVLDAPEFGTKSTLLAVNSEIEILLGGAHGENLKRNWKKPEILAEIQRAREASSASSANGDE